MTGYHLVTYGALVIGVAAVVTDLVLEHHRRRRDRLTDLDEHRRRLDALSAIHHRGRR